MINNNPYNIPQKQPLAQSKILSETNNYINSSPYLQNRSDKQVMYSSAIFTRNSGIMNSPYQQNFYDPNKLPLSPRPKFGRPSNVQFLTPSQPIKPIDYSIQNNHMSKETPMYEKQIQGLKQKIQTISKKLSDHQNAENYRKQNKNQRNSITTLQQSLSNSQKLSNSEYFKEKDITEQFQKFMTHSQEQNKKIWLKISKLEDIFTSINASKLERRIQDLEQRNDTTTIENSRRSHSGSDQFLLNRIKSIQKSIRQMGQDIHLINDKEQSSQQNFRVALQDLQNEVKYLKVQPKNSSQSLLKLAQINTQIYQMRQQIQTIERSFQKKLKQKFDPLQTRLKSLSTSLSPPSIISSSIAKCFHEPILLKYLQKFQITHKQKNICAEQLTINELTYYIDNEGYLLDNDRFYLINEETNERIRLQSKHIELLRRNRVLI